MDGRGPRGPSYISYQGHGTYDFWETNVESAIPDLHKVADILVFDSAKYFPRLETYLDTRQLVHAFTYLWILPGPFRFGGLRHRPEALEWARR